MRNDSMGIYCLEDKIFYYLESGNNYVSNTVDRIKRTLIKRNLIEFTPESFLDTKNYKVMTCKDATLAGYTMTAIFVSKHIQTVMAAGEANEEVESSERKTTWGK